MNVASYKTYLTILLILFSFELQAIELPCNTEDLDEFINANSVVFMDISIPKSKKWNKNYLNAVRDNQDADILQKYKKKFNANIKVRFDNELECIFPAKVRISGDHKDHIDSIPFIASLDVKLLSGNINSIVKFKLFIPHTKGGNNEVFSTALLTELGFLAPKTYHVPAIFNGIETTFLFQEKVTKEFVELNHFREAPILEGDERFLFANDKDGFDRFGLSRVENNKWAMKGYTSLNISRVALAQLNKAYLEYLYGKHIYKNRNDRFLGYNTFLNNDRIEKDREFKAILVAMGASHGLRPHNRKFYFDPMYQYFIPIYYDGNSRVLDLHAKSFLYFGDKLNKDEIIGSTFALNSIGKINQDSFSSKLKKLGLSYSPNEVSVILNRLIENLKIINNAQIASDRTNTYVPYFSNYKTLKKDKKKLVFSTESNSYVEICDLSVISCRYEMLGIEEYAKLLGGRYSDKNETYIFIGDKQEYLSGISVQKKQVKSNYVLENGVRLIVYGGAKVLINKEEKTIYLHQNDIGDRFLLAGGSLEDWSIEFVGFAGKKSTNKQRFNQSLLTGCLTLLDMSVDNIAIDVKGALCEDGVNLVRVNGNLNSITVRDALSDAVDIDFSELQIYNVSVTNAGNDCVDLSSGNYHIVNSELYNCSDKAVSVGEKSKLSIGLSKISDANIGLASKDSSVLEADSVFFDNTITCFSAYNKKQEFWGGRLMVSNHNCQLSQIIQQKGSLVEFVK